MSTERYDDYSLNSALSSRHQQTNAVSRECVEIDRMFRDIGEVGVPDAIFRKVGVLTPEELAEIKITNALGQEVTNLIYITHENGSTLLIDLSNLSQGLYYVKTRTTTNSVYKK